MRRSRLLFGGIVLLIALPLLLRSLLSPPAVQGFPVQAQPFVATVVVSGRIATPSRVLVASEVLATVRERRVSEGDRVEPGQVLLVLDDAPLRARMEEVEAQLLQLRERLRPETEASLSEAVARRRQAERDARRARELARGG